MATVILTETVKFLTKQVFKLITKAVKAENKILRISERNIEDAIGMHLEKVNTFTSEISFKELNKPKSLLSVYIPLDISIKAVSNRNLTKTDTNSSHLNLITDEATS